MRYGFYLRSKRNTECVDFPRDTGQLSPSSGVTHGRKSKLKDIQLNKRTKKCLRRKGRFPVKADIDGHEDKQTRNETKGRGNEETAAFHHQRVLLFFFSFSALVHVTRISLGNETHQRVSYVH
jgi:hypothetical protein